MIRRGRSFGRMSGERGTGYQKENGSRVRVRMDWRMRRRLNLCMNIRTPYGVDLVRIILLILGFCRRNEQRRHVPLFGHSCLALRGLLSSSFHLNG